MKVLENAGLRHLSGKLGKRILTFLPRRIKRKLMEIMAKNEKGVSQSSRKNI